MKKLQDEDKKDIPDMNDLPPGFEIKGPGCAVILITLVLAFACLIGSGEGFGTILGIGLIALVIVQWWTS